MKVRIGYGLGTRASSDPDRFAALVTGLEAHRFDSLWLSERVTGDCPDPIVGLGVAAGLTTKIKFGFSVLVVPGRNPMLLAKELATLDRLSRGRLLPAFGLGAVDPGEHQAFGVERGDRAKIFNEVLPLLRRFWAGETVDHDGAFHHYEGAVVRPLPLQDPLEIWLGGIAPSELQALRAARRRLAAVVLHARRRPRRHRRHPGHRRRARPPDRPRALRRPHPLLRRADPRDRGGRRSPSAAPTSTRPG